uniref:VWFA domain-containing protein n=1 Tax=Panagrellus redivivus TaxID=6233 RepID=A0A7E4VC76_PANRE
MKLLSLLFCLIAGALAVPVPDCATTVPPPPPSPSGHDGFPCANTPKSAWLDLTIVIELSKVMSDPLLEIQNNLKTYLKQLTIANVEGHASRIAIIGYDESNATLIHGFTDEQSFAAVSGKINALKTSTVSSDKASIVKGLQLAKTHIDANRAKKIPGVVLYAATYNDKDDNDPTVAADELKSDMIKVSTITFETILGVYTPEIGKLASEGLAFNSTTTGGFGKAIATLNCVCPKEWTQLIITTPTSSTPTVYAECFKPYESEAEPDLLTCPENGFLVAVHTEKRFNFLVKRILPLLSKSTGVSVGLFREGPAATWKWHTVGGTVGYTGYPEFNSTAPGDVYGYLNTKEGWELETDDGSVARAYVCARRSCDTDNICDLALI